MPLWFYIVLLFGIGLLAGAGEWIGGHIDAAVKHRRAMQLHRLQANLPAPSPQPVCGCTHHIAFHDPETGRCNADVRVATEWKRSKNGDPVEVETAWKVQQCPCRRYAGPEPLVELTAPELSQTAMEHPRRPPMLDRPDIA